MGYQDTGFIGDHPAGRLPKRKREEEEDRERERELPGFEAACEELFGLPAPGGAVALAGFSSSPNLRRSPAGRRDGLEVAQLLEAADFAAHKHRRQRRMDPEGTPYINHPIGGRAARGVTSAASGGTGWGGSGTALSTCSAPSFGPRVVGVARILTHEAGVTDLAVLQVTPRQEAGVGTGGPPFSAGHPLAGVAGLSGSLSPGGPAPRHGGGHGRHPEEVELRFGARVRRLVEEVTDDKTLPKPERKRLQVERAPHSSPGAKLVKLADKLYNLRDLNRCTPKGWSEHRVQEYFEWAAQVVRGLQGTSPRLEEALQQLFRERGLTL
ncbi:hypothetical protein QTO34_012692 [Cnephaeus nilssonii]|uniref:MESH1 n=1 Tax=Cnephaeus nilssonii TaxID=3371016 RepID=A0AA40HB18_CNENI|nr:hypothetical protein QTO34_012692 [Eptesicus nilssonii]